MIHQPWIGGLQGQTTDIEIHAKEMVKTRDKLYKILANHTGKSTDQIMKDCDRDYYLTADESVEYKLIDKVFEKRKMPGEEEK